MKVREWERIEAVLQAALERAPGERTLFLNEACAGDAALREEVASLLALQTDAANFLESPAASAADWLNDAEDDTLSVIGEKIGAYRIIREIARGGMGVVYLAERDDDEFKKQVAVKLIKRDFDSAELRRRFRYERQILASLDHPNIAHLLDGGTTEDGRPFLVMEYVEGESITRYAEENQLSTEARLELFRTVCAAVQHAHQHLVIHRDIKPSNILVTEEGVPKLLDFGIAKLLKPTAGDAATETVTLRGVMTPEYASPEQIKGETVTTATDVYSLGVALYELLTGARPFRFASRRPDEIARVICEQEPKLPSTAASHVEESKPKTNQAQPSARAAASTIEALPPTDARDKRDTAAPPQPSAKRETQRHLQGDLDNIVLMAMRKDPARRYASVGEFSEDIRRYLAGLPVIARRDTLKYRASKFVHRNKLGVAASALVLLAVLAGFAATVWQARVAAREKDQAQQARAREEQINKFLQSILSVASPEMKGRDAKVIEVLNDAAARVDTEFANQPELRAQALLTVGATYADLGLVSEADGKLREALKLNLELHGEVNKATAANMTLLGGVALNEAHFEEAGSLLSKAVETDRKLSPMGSRELAFALFALGELYVRRSDYRRAESLLQESVAMFDKASGENEDMAFALVSLGRAQLFSGDATAAEKSFRQSIAIFRNLPPRFQVRMAYALLGLGSLLASKGSYDEGLAAMRQAEAIFQTQQGESFNLFESKFYLCTALTDKGDYGDAAEEGRKAIAIGRKVNLENTPDFIWTLNYLGLALTRAGRPKEGEPILREALERSRKNFPPDDTRIPRIESVLGECLTAQNRFAEAEPLATRSCESLRARLSEKSPLAALACKRVDELYEKWKKPNERK